MTLRPLPPIPTRVGHAGWDDNRYFGRGVLHDLVGSAGYLDLLVLAVGREPLSPESNRLLEDVLTCAMAADPRIWPLKIARLSSSYGGVLIPLCAAQAWFENAAMGPWTAASSAAALQRLSDALGDAAADPRAVAAALTVDLGPEGRLPGFGVAFRPEDERVAAVIERLRQRGHAPGRFWQLAQTIAEVLRSQQRPLNIYGAFAAIALDMAFTAEQIGVLATVLLSVNLVANVVEGARQTPEVLQRLPDDRIRYVGPALRPSPRATAARG